MPRYRSLKTGRYVSEHYGKRNPKMAIKEERRTIKEPEVPSERITVEQAREAARKVKEERGLPSSEDVRERMLEQLMKEPPGALCWDDHGARLSYEQPLSRTYKPKHGRHE